MKENHVLGRDTGKIKYMNFTIHCRRKPGWYFSENILEETGHIITGQTE